MITGLFLMLLALVGIIAIMVWIVQLPFVALLINIGFIAIVLSALRWATTVDIRRHRTTYATPDVGTALDVLNARYARGEIERLRRAGSQRISVVTAVYFAPMTIAQ